MGGADQVDGVRQGSQRHGFSSLIVKSFTAVVVAAIMLAGLALFSATRQSDAASVERQARAARQAIDVSTDELALQQETVAVWDDAASRLVAPQIDLDWLDGNVGSWLHRMFRHDEVAILDGNDVPVYAAVSGARVPSRRYHELAPQLAPLVDAVRGRDRHPAGKHDRLPGQPLSKHATVQTTARSTHDTHMAVIGGRPAAVSAMLVKPSTEGYVRPNGEWPILISVRYLDGAFLRDLGERQLIDNARFSRSSATLPREYATEIRREQGELIGYLIWRPELPGTGVLRQLLPWTLLSLAALAGFISLLGHRLKRAVGEVAAAERQAAHLASHDPLTQLPNRALFQRRLDALTSNDGEPRPRFALALLDVDNFKLTNDTLGHDAGDALLAALAERLKNCTHEGDMVARLGGDEFAVLLVGVDRVSQVEKLAARLLERLREPFEHHGKQIDCHVSIGASLYRDRDSSLEILKQADLALYEAKASGRGVYRLYEQRMWSSVLLRQRMLSNARDALEGDYIRPFYQPKVDLRTGAITGFEALLRCCPPGSASLGPDHLEAAFEDSMLAAELSQRMIDAVAEDVAGWRAERLPFGHVAINAAAAELRRGDYAERLLSSLKRRWIPAECIQVEVTESVLLGRGLDHVERALQQLAASGMKLALDDFGTGFASLSHLKQFPVDIIKIDRSFIRELQIDPEDGAIVDALVGLASALNIEVVAEGIETTAQRDFLAALGCTSGQGFLFGKPVPAGQVAEMLRKQLKPPRRAA